MQAFHKRLPYPTPPFPPRTTLLETTLATLDLPSFGFSATQSARRSMLLRMADSPQYHTREKTYHSNQVQFSHPLAAALLLLPPHSLVFLFLGSPRWLLSFALRCVDLTQP
jgi:hypothetical protein